MLFLVDGIKGTIEVSERNGAQAKVEYNSIEDVSDHIRKTIGKTLPRKSVQTSK